MYYPSDPVSQSLVKRIQEGLEHYDAPSACELEIKSELYTNGHQVYCEVTREIVESYCSYLSEQICDALHQEQQGARQVLNVCSVGCGDGGSDHKMLSKVYQAFPTASINYLGIDMNETSCTRAKEALSSLPPSCKVNVINSNILEVDTQSLPKFDIVILAHVHYHFVGRSSLSSLFVKLLELRRPESGRIEVITDVPTPLWYLEVVFGPSQVTFSQLMEFLPSLGLPYLTRSLPPMKLQFSDLFGPDSAQSREADAEAVLTFFCQRNLKAYPAPIVSLCAAYVKSCLDPKGQCDFGALAISLPHRWK